MHLTAGPLLNSTFAGCLNYSTVETFESDEVDAEGIKSFLRAAFAFNESSGIGQQDQHAVEFKDPQWTTMCGLLSYRR